MNPPLLKKQLLIYSDGFGWEQWSLPLTTYKKKKLTSVDLQERLEEILSAVSSGERDTDRASDELDQERDDHPRRSRL